MYQITYLHPVLTKSSIQSLSHVRLFATPWTAAQQASLFITNSQSLLRLMPIESVMPSNHFILCHLLLLLSISPSMRVFSSESVLHITWPKYWSSGFGISPASECPGLVSFRTDWSQPSAKTCACLFVQRHSNHTYTDVPKKGCAGFGSAYGPSESVARDFQTMGL